MKNPLFKRAFAGIVCVNCFQRILQRIYDLPVSLPVVQQVSHDEVYVCLYRFLVCPEHL